MLQGLKSDPIRSDQQGDQVQAGCPNTRDKPPASPPWKPSLALPLAPTITLTLTLTLALVPTLALPYPYAHTLYPHGRYNGLAQDLPVLLAYRGQVYDVSSSPKLYQKGGSYEV